jgi:hypothetical protein
MNFQKIFWGFVLLLLGLMMLLKHLGIVHFHFWMLFHLWPVILILWGIFLLPIKNNLKAILSVGIVLLSFALASYISKNRPDYFKNPHEIYFHDHNGSDEWDDPYFDSDSSTTDI